MQYVKFDGPKAVVNMPVATEYVIDLVSTVGALVKCAGAIEYSVLFQFLETQGWNLRTYNACVNLLKRTKIVHQEGTKLHWIVGSEK
jgi:hypothetical protein